MKKRISENYQKLSKLDKLILGAFFIPFILLCIVLFIITLFLPKEYSDKLIFIGNIAEIIATFILAIYALYRDSQERKKKEDFRNRVFGTDYKVNTKNKTNYIGTFASNTFYFVLFTFLLALVLIVIKLYVIQFGKNGFSNQTGDWSNFGNYMSGTVGIILALVACILTFFLYLQQKKQNEISRTDFKQNQFETIFFKLSKKMVKHAKQNNIYQFYLLLRIIFIEMDEYSNGERIAYAKYVDILKTFLSNEILTRMFIDKDMQNANGDSELYIYIKNIIEEYSLFQCLDLDFSTASNNLAINKHKIKKFKISAYEKNHKIMPIRISLEENPDELKKYSTHPEKAVRKAVAENKNTPIEILEQLSQDSEEEVRQAAINTINSLKSQNDENN